MTQRALWCDTMGCFGAFVFVEFSTGCGVVATVTARRRRACCVATGEPGLLGWRGTDWLATAGAGRCEA